MKIENKQNSDKVNILRSPPVGISLMLKHGGFCITFHQFLLLYTGGSARVIQNCSAKML